MKLSIAVSGIGAFLGGIGFGCYQAMTEVIMRGDSYGGLGWLFSDISYQQAHLLQGLAIASMVFGGILLVFGLVRALKK